MALQTQEYNPSANTESLDLLILVACKEIERNQTEDLLRRNIEELEKEVREKTVQLEHCRSLLSDRRKPTACRRCKERKIKVLSSKRFSDARSVPVPDYMMQIKNQLSERHVNPVRS